MMPQLIETFEIIPGPHCTSEQARELLEALRSAYQSLLPVERTFVRCVVSQVERQQLLRDID